VEHLAEEERMERIGGEGFFFFFFLKFYVLDGYFCLFGVISLRHNIRYKYDQNQNAETKETK